jgi:AbrB family looped-hinge helix DNA binding protein
MGITIIASNYFGNNDFLRLDSTARPFIVVLAFVVCVGISVYACRMTLQVNITPNGRMSLPIGIRKRLGLEEGGAVLIEETPDGVILRTVDQAVAKAQSIAKRYAQLPDASIDAFLARRRQGSGE